VAGVSDVPMKQLVFRAAAKINLNLDVLGRRADGYHELFTTFQAIDLFDTLTFEKTGSGGIQIASNHPEFPTGPENLIYRVFAQAGRNTTEPINVRVTVDKRIPIAAGLGGGSADAAAALFAANALYSLSLTGSQLHDWAGEIGADVPFFLGNAQAEGRGRGDAITPVEFYADYWLAVIKPAVGLSTAEVYRALDLGLTKRESGVNFAGCRDREDFFSRLVRAQNALTAPVIRLCPEAGCALRFLEEQGSVAARVTGSGPCVFGIFRDTPNLGELRRAFPTAEWQVFVCRPLAGQAAVGQESTDRQGADRGNHRSAHYSAG